MYDIEKIANLDLMELSFTNPLPQNFEDSCDTQILIHFCEKGRNMVFQTCEKKSELKRSEGDYNNPPPHIGGWGLNRTSEYRK